MWSKSAPTATEKAPHRQSARGSDERPRLPRNTHSTRFWAAQRLTVAISGSSPDSDLAAEVRLRLLLQRRDSTLRQRCRFGGRIFFLHLLVNLLGLIRLLPRLVEAGEFKLRASFADDERRLIHQLLIEIARLRVLVLRALNVSQRELAQGRQVGVRRVGGPLQTAFGGRVVAKLCRGQAHKIARH